MPLRLVEIHLPGAAGDVRDLLDEVDVVDILTPPEHDDDHMRVLVEAEKTEPLLDRVEQRFGHRDGFRIVLLPVHATVPRPPEKEPEPESETGPAAVPPDRISREELMSALKGGTRVNSIYMATVLLSAVVAAVGLIQDSVAVIIGAMVIAPLLLPNMAAALATTLGDFPMLRKALRTNLWGVGLAFGLALAMGAIMRPDVTAEEITARTSVRYTDILLALASGSAGALAFTSGVSAGLVGVMVAVALMPPLVVAGLLLGLGRITPGCAALLLLFTNVICVNLAAVVTFLIQGIRPRTWWEADKARRATRHAVVLWTTLLVVLAALIYVTQA